MRSLWVTVVTIMETGMVADILTIPNNDGWNGSNNPNSNTNKHKGHNCEEKKGKGYRKYKHNYNCDGDNS